MKSIDQDNKIAILSDLLQNLSSGQRHIFAKWWTTKHIRIHVKFKLLKISFNLLKGFNQATFC